MNTTATTEDDESQAKPKQGSPPRTSLSARRQALGAANPATAHEAGGTGPVWRIWLWAQWHHLLGAKPSIHPPLSLSLAHAGFRCAKPREHSIRLADDEEHQRLVRVELYRGV